MALQASLEKFRRATKDQAVARWQSLESKLKRIQAESVETMKRLGLFGTGFGTFALSLYLKERAKLSGRRVTFDKAGRVDVAFTTGLGLAALGVLPILGDAAPFVTVGGLGVAQAGAVDFIQRTAVEHHNK